VCNVASQCGFTPQYKELAALHDQYASKGLVVIGAPCNQCVPTAARRRAVCACRQCDVCYLAFRRLRADLRRTCTLLRSSIVHLHTS
jgi:glutathione peroxidase-family protein